MIVSQLPIGAKLSEVPEIVFYCPDFMYQIACASVSSVSTMSLNSLVHKLLSYLQSSPSQKCLDHIDEIIAAKIIS